MNNNENTKFCPMIGKECIKEKCAFWCDVNTEILQYSGCDYSGHINLMEELERSGNELGRLNANIERHNELLGYIAEFSAK